MSRKLCSPKTGAVIDRCFFAELEKEGFIQKLWK
jgi:hypothetical protein